jgi:hypothetical protein
MNSQAKLAAAFVGLSLFALVAAYAFFMGLMAGEIGCFGRGCRGTASLAAQPAAYLVYMCIAGFSAAFFGSLAAYSLVQLLRGNAMPPNPPFKPMPSARRNLRR